MALTRTVIDQHNRLLVVGKHDAIGHTDFDVEVIGTNVIFACQSEREAIQFASRWGNRVLVTE